MSNEYQSNEEYFKDHPEEEATFYDDMAKFYCVGEIIDYPEDWCM